MQLVFHSKEISGEGVKKPFLVAASVFLQKIVGYLKYISYI
jgi:hypothetical protein